MSDNPIIARFGNVNIRERNFVKVVLSADEYVKVLTVVNETGFSASKVIALQGRECQNCGKDNLQVNIPKNLISAKRQSSGESNFSRTLKEIPDNDV